MKQLTITGLDLSDFGDDDLTGSYSDDLGDTGSKGKVKRKSKYCETWNFDERRMEEHLASYRDVMISIFKNYKKAQKEEPKNESESASK
jgi:hypothetical protein